jgi:hypothetical protein
MAERRRKGTRQVHTRKKRTKNNRRKIRKVADKSKRLSRKVVSTPSATNPIISFNSSSGVQLPMDDIKTQLFSYADQIQTYLANVNAKVGAFNFGVEKSEKGIIIDCQVKAEIGGIENPTI